MYEVIDIFECDIFTCDYYIIQKTFYFLITKIVICMNLYFMYVIIQDGSVSTVLNETIVLILIFSNKINNKIVVLK